MKKLFIFPFNFRGKTDVLIEEVINKNPLDVLYISPHTGKIRDFKLKYYKRTSRGLLPTTHTIKTLALNILDSASEKKIISDVERYITILQILKKKGAEGKYKYALSGMALAISHFIKDVKVSTEGDISPQQIKQKICEFEWKFDYNKSLVLFAIDVMDEYLKFMEHHKLLDMEDIYKEATKYVKELKFTDVLFDSFCEVPVYQRRFIAEIIRYIPSVVFSFPYDEGVSIDVKELILDSAFSYLKKVYNWKEKRFERENRELDIECYNFASQSEEIEGIIKIIGNALGEHPDWTLNDIITVFPSMPSYRPVVHRLFKRYKIPAEIVPGYSLVQEPSISTLLEIFAFKNSYNWTTLMDILLCPNFYNIDKQDAFDFSAKSRDKFYRVGFVKEDFERLSSKNINIVKEVLKKIEGGPKPLKKWVEDIEEILELLNWVPPYPEVKVRFQKILYEMKKDMLVSEEEFVNILKKALELVEIEESRGSGIRVSGVQEGVGMEKKMCIVGGATDENIPGVPHIEELFIPDTLKKQLGFTHHSLRMARERLDLYRIENENEKVIFTYPSKIQNRNQMKSVFLFKYSDKILETRPFISQGIDIFKNDLSPDKFLKKFVVDGKLNLSVTELESLLQCPYRFYLERVEGLKPYRVPQIEETPELWGNIIHSVMHNIFQGYENKIISKQDIEKHIESFREGVLTEIDTQHREGKISTLYKNVLSVRVDEVINKFSLIIKNHCGNKFVTAEFEIEYDIHCLHITGKIDRIEETPSGEIIIIDIKTGTMEPPSYTEENFFDKFNIQIPLYMWMYSKKFNIPREKMIGSIWRFAFIEKEEEKKKSELEKFYYGKNKKMQYLDSIEKFFCEIAERIIRGEYSFIPEEPKNCYVCNYKRMCPYGSNE